VVLSDCAGPFSLQGRLGGSITQQSLVPQANCYLGRTADNG
jgi:hypothetical protein